MTIVYTLLLSCSVGKDYQKPINDLPKKFLKEDDTSYRDNYLYYSELFDNDAGLKAFLTRLENDNLTLKQALKKVEEYLELYGIGLRENLPAVELSAALEKRKRSEAVASAIQNPYNDFVSVGGNIAWEIDIFGRIRRLNESRKAEVEEHLELARGIKLFLTNGFLSIYFDYRNLQELLELVIGNLRAYTDSVAVIKARYEAGLDNKLDFLLADSKTAQYRLTLASLQNEVELKKSHLANLLGVYAKDLEKELSFSNALPEIDSLKFPKTEINLIRARPDIRSAERKLAKLHALIGVAKAAFYPKLSIAGRFSFESLNALENAFLTKGASYAAGPAIDWSIINFDVIRKQVNVQGLRYEQAFDNYKDTVIKAVNEVEVAKVNFKQAYFKQLELNNSQQSKQKIRDLTQKQYQHGLKNTKDFLNAEISLFETKILAKRNEAEVRRAYINLYKSLGVG